MSCQVKLSGVITDITTIRRCLFPLDEQRGSDSWLQLCEISVSPSGDIIAIANDSRLVVLSADWNINTSLFNYHVNFCDVLEDDQITSVLCLPIIMQSQSSQVGPEWTCIAVGFQSGFVRFYTEDCKLLLCEQYHVEKVCDIKCQSQHSPRPDINSELRIEELYVHYPSNVCILSGNQLFGVLRSHRSQLIRGDFNATLNNLSIVPKKWGFVDQYSVNDSNVVGLELANTFDHLLTASSCGGFDTKYRAVAPNNTLVLGVGNKPFIGFHYAIEGGTQPMLTDVAKAIASKMKSALPGWLTGGKAQQDKPPTAASQSAEPMGCRFGICDIRRTGINVILSPNRKLAAVTDILGRVSVLDVRQGVLIRMFKGFRDAQCAFIQVPEEKRSRHKSNARIATFLIVYCPKKGTLEILSAQQGVKIAVFTASKFGRLLYITHGLMGLSTSSRSKYACQYTCVLMDPDGKLKEIVIPFHFALPEKNSKRARDVHLYKRLKHFIKTSNYNCEQLLSEALNTCKELKTTSIQFQCLEMLTTYKEVYPEVVLECSKFFLQKTKTSAASEADTETKSLKKFSENLIAVTQFFMYVMQFQNSSNDKNGNKSTKNVQIESKDSVKNNKKKKKVLETNTDFFIGTKEMNNLQRLLDLCTLNENKSSPEVSFSCDDFMFSQFLSVFDLTNCNQINLKPKTEQSILLLASKMIFSSFVLGNCGNIEDFKLNIINSNISIRDLFQMLLYYWVNRPFSMSMNLEREMQNLNHIIYEVIKTADIPDVIVEYNKISSFWSQIREMLANSEKPFPALTAALICRSVSLTIEHEKELQNSGTSLEEESLDIWEKLSQENCEWMLLIGKLEDVSLLNIILSNKPNVKNKELFTLPKLKHESDYVSLKVILEKGKGSVSEFIAQWLTTSGINPQELVTTKNSEEDGNNSEKPNFDQDEPVLQNLNLIRNQFPYSADGSILLTNMCWEYALAWQRNINEFSYLTASLQCLNAITNVHLKQGMYNLLWNTHLKIIFEGTCKLANKVGKMPKEKLCRQDTGLSDTQVLKFIEICTEFLDTYLDIIQLCYNSERVKLQYEQIWENGGQPLGELALQQTHINYDLVHLHFQLSLVIHMLMIFNIKHTKPVNNMFDNDMVSLFFTDFQQKVQINWHRSETKVLASRTQFLLKAISATIEMFTVNEGKVYSADHAKWIGKILSLARVWNLDIDVLKRFQIVQLYINGYDSVAEELLPAVTELDKLGPDLIGISGKRLLHYISSSKDLTEKITTISPGLKQYLDSLNGDWCAPSSLEAITNIVIYSLQFIREDQKEYKIATQLFEACSALQEIDR